MSRYIEIIFDNSGSMTSLEKGKPRHVLAKEIFNINKKYRVVLNENTRMPTFSINEISKRQQDGDARTLRDGDFIYFDCN